MRIHAKQPITCICSLLLIFGCLSTVAQTQSETLVLLLESDHEQLREKSPTFKAAGISFEQFAQDFEDGITKAAAMRATVASELPKHTCKKALKKGAQKWKRVQREPTASHLPAPSKIAPLKNKQSLLLKDGKDAPLAVFSGSWFGIWQTDSLRHHWLPPRTVSLGQSGYKVVFQSVSIHDGYGWNYLYGKGEELYLLGYVIRWDSAYQVKQKVPHIGILNSPNCITWLTQDHVYVEQVCEATTCGISGKHYVISGVSYSNPSRHKVKIDKVFQAIYSSKDLKQASYREF